jgi:tetratricopeptide (TPR) repeat protein
MRKTILMFLLLILELNSCNKSDKRIKQEDGYCFAGKNYSSQVVSLNNKAMGVLCPEMYSIGIDTQKINVVLAILDSAIVLDSTYYIAYYNKAVLLFELNKLEESIRCMRLITDKCEDYAEGNMMIGMLYESLGETGNAREHYTRSLKTYQKRNCFKHKLANRQNEIFLYLMLNEKDSAAYVIRNLTSEFPSETIAIDEFKNEIKKYDRKAFIKSTICFR